jgi:hypothetical protein
MKGNLNTKLSTEELFREMIKTMIQEVESEEEIEESTVTGNVDGYNVPNAFGKPEGDAEKASRLAKASGYSVVTEDKSWKRFLDPYNWGKSKDIFQNRFKNVPSSVVDKLIKNTEKNGDAVERVGKNVWGINPDSAEDSQAVWQYLNGHLYYTNPHHKSEYDTIIPKLVNSKIEVYEGVNRYHELRNDDSTPTQKIGKGMSEIRKQLQEMEKFITWYSKIKTETGLESSQYWKRTQKNLNVIRERLNKISQKIYNLSA